MYTCVFNNLLLQVYNAAIHTGLVLMSWMQLNHILLKMVDVSVMNTWFMIRNKNEGTSSLGMCHQLGNLKMGQCLSLGVTLM